MAPVLRTNAVTDVKRLSLLNNCNTCSPTNPVEPITIAFIKLIRKHFGNITWNYSNDNGYKRC